MEDLMTVVREANEGVAELRRSWKTNNDVNAHYAPFFERVKEQCANLEEFVDISFSDFQQRLKSGTTPQPESHTLIGIPSDWVKSKIENKPYKFKHEREQSED